MTPWSEAEVERLTALAGQGYSAGLIASRLCIEFGTGRSRNSVIGKMMRGKGQFGRLHLLPRNKGTRNSERASSSRAGKAGAASPHRAAPATPLASRAKGAPVGRTNVPDVRSDAPPAAEVPMNLPVALPISFEAAVDGGRCLYFVGDPYAPSGPDMPVCGAERAEGVLHTRYCRKHLISQCQVVAA
jgi:GcrA cell cycle regulator